jgi:hypothetical protein
MPRDRDSNSAAMARYPEQRLKTTTPVAQELPIVSRPDWIVTLCFVLIYLELAWLIMLFLHSYSRH